MKKQFLTIKELQVLTGVSKSKTTSIARDLNKELEEEGFVAIRGKIPIQLAREKFPYNDLSDEAIKELEEQAYKI